MESMAEWVFDVGLAVLLAGLEVAALLAVWFVGAIERWGAKGAPVPDRMGRDVLVLSVAVASSALIGYGCSLATAARDSCRS